MRNSMLLTLWYALSAEDRKSVVLKFSRISDEPEMATIFETLQAYSKQQKAFPTKVVLFSLIFGADRVFNDPLLRKTLSKAFHVLELFITQQQQPAALHNHVLRTYYLRNNLQKHFAHITEVASDAAANLFLPSSVASDWFWQNYASTALWEKKHDASTWMKAQSTELIGFATQRLRQSCQWAENQRKYNTPAPDALIPHLLAQLQAVQTENQPLFLAWHLSFKLLFEAENTSDFNQLIVIILDPNFEGDFLQQRELFQLSLNYCSRLYNKGDKSLLANQLQLFKTGLDRGLLLEQGYIKGYTFTNMVTIGLIHQSFDWVDEMMLTFGQLVVANQRTGILAFNQARLCYARQQYTEVLQLLQNAIYDDLLLNLSAKTVQLKTYYALMEWNALQSHVEAMRQFIRRHKELSYHRDNFLNLLNFVIRIQKSQNKPAKLLLKTEIESTTSLAEKEWLIELLK